MHTRAQTHPRIRCERIAACRITAALIAIPRWFQMRVCKGLSFAARLHSGYERDTLLYVRPMRSSTRLVARVARDGEARESQAAFDGVCVLFTVTSTKFQPGLQGAAISQKESAPLHLLPRCLLHSFQKKERKLWAAWSTSAAALQKWKCGLPCAARGHCHHAAFIQPLLQRAAAARKRTIANRKPVCIATSRHRTNNLGVATADIMFNTLPCVLL